MMTRFGKLMTVVSSSCLLRHGFSLRREKVTSFRSLNIQNQSETKDHSIYDVMKSASFRSI